MSHTGKVAIVGLAALILILSGNFFSSRRRQCAVWFDDEGFPRFLHRLGERTTPEEIALLCKGKTVVVSHSGAAIVGDIEAFVGRLRELGLTVSFFRAF